MTSTPPFKPGDRVVYARPFLSAARDAGWEVGKTYTVDRLTDGEYVHVVEESLPNRAAHRFDLVPAFKPGDKAIVARKSKHSYFHPIGTVVEIVREDRFGEVQTVGECDFGRGVRPIRGQIGVPIADLDPYVEPAPEPMTLQRGDLVIVTEGATWGCEDGPFGGPVGVPLRVVNPFPDGDGDLYVSDDAEDEGHYVHASFVTKAPAPAPEAAQPEALRAQADGMNAQVEEALATVHEARLRLVAVQRARQALRDTASALEALQ